MRRPSNGFLVAVLLLGGCARGGGDDSGVPERDAGTSGIDSGAQDAGRPVDSGAGDAGGSPFDAGAMTGDAGVDAGIDAEVDAGSDCRTLGCAALDGPCTLGVCDATTGVCDATPLTDGSACDDGVVCTESVCMAGTCAGTALDCSAMDSACSVGMCDPAIDACTAAPVADGTSCDTDPADCAAPTCQAGVCTMANSADCSPCSVAGGSYCATGTCGAGASTLTYDFESGLPAGWTVGGDAGFVIGTARSHGGANAAGSGSITHSQTSSMFAPFSFSAPVELSMWVFTSTESCCDRLRLYVDGAERGRWGGSTGWTQVRTVLSAGPHMVEWRYSKDSSVSTGDDRVFVDDVVVIPAPTDQGFEAAGLPAGYTTSGDASWTVTTSQAHTGTRSAQSGSISDSETTRLFTTASYAAAGNVTFWRRVSSESSYDYLEFYIDGARQGRWAGSLTTWTQETYAIAAGSHMLEWRYLKDGSVSSGADTVWIDDIVATDAMPASNLCDP